MLSTSIHSEIYLETTIVKIRFGCTSVPNFSVTYSTPCLHRSLLFENNGSQVESTVSSEICSDQPCLGNSINNEHWF